MPPRRFGPYELRELLGQGGMGEVYRAYDTVRRREVAIKLLKGDLAADEAFQVRFRRESQLVARLSDPHIIPIHDFGEIDDRLFIDMRLVRGQDLAAVLRTARPLPVSSALDIAEQVADALDAAHDVGLVHRDVKPSNILIAGGPGTRPFAYLVDFGIARAVNPESSAVTTAGSGAYGSVPYLAPERINGEPGDARTDVYALACVLFEMVTGRRPWEGDLYTVLGGHLTQTPPRPTTLRPDLPSGLDDVLVTGLAKSPDRRYARAGELVAAARAAVAGSPSSMSASPSATASPYPPPPAVVTDLRVAALSAAGAAAPPVRHTRAWVAVATVVVLAVAALIVAVTLRPDDHATAGRAIAPPTRHSTGPSGLHAGHGTTRTWADFASFSSLVGRRDGDTAHSFRNAKCTLGAPSESAPAGLVDQVACGDLSSPIQVFVGRFGTAAQAQTYTHQLLNAKSAVVTAWGIGGVPRGLAYTTAAKGIQPVSIDTTVCGLPTYVVRIFGADSTLTTTSLHDDYWNSATFPDVVPPACTTSYGGGTGPTGGAMTAAKANVPIDLEHEGALLKRYDPHSTYQPVAISGGNETLTFDGEALVFYLDTAAGLRVDTEIGDSTKPDLRVHYVAEGEVLSGMTRPVFVVDIGPEDKPADASLVLAYGAKGWGLVGPDGKNRLVIRDPSSALTESVFTYATLGDTGGDYQLRTTTSNVTTYWRPSGTTFTAVKRVRR